MPLLPDVERIAVLRANGIGDLIFALPALESLRAAYPHARITLLGAPWHAELLQGRPAPVDEVVVVPPSRGVLEGAGPYAGDDELEAFFERMRERRFDLALQMHGGGRYSNQFTLKLGARTSAGLTTPGAAPLDIQLPYVYYQSEVMRNLEIVMLVGAEPLHPQARLVPTDADRAEAQRALPEASGPLVLVHPAAGDPRRRWPAEKFAAVADRLAADGARVALVAGESSGHLTAAVARAMREPALDLAGRLGLGGLLGLLERSALLVTNDSGPLHVAAAVGTPTVAIYWCGNMINAGLPFRARHRPILSWRLDCPICGANCTAEGCDHDASFVADVEVEEVEGAAVELLSATSTPGATGTTPATGGQA